MSDREFMPRPTKRAKPTNVVAAKLKSLLTEAINTQDGLLGDALDALRAVLPYAKGVSEDGEHGKCKYCHKVTNGGLPVCLACAVGMSQDVLDTVPTLSRREPAIEPPVESTEEGK